MAKRHPIIYARADRARKAMTGGGYESMEDLVADLLHLADIDGFDFDLLVEEARDQYRGETGDGDDIEQDARRIFTEEGVLA